MSKADKLQTIANNLATESETVKQQTELLQQIRTALGGKTVPGDPGDSGSYDEGYADGQQDVLDAVNYELAGRGLEEVASVDEIPHKLDDAFITLESNGYESGKQAEYDAFWDAYQNDGKRTLYQYAFSYDGWTDNSYNPKYDIVCVGPVIGMFQYSDITDTKRTIDLTQATDMSAAFRRNQYLKTIRKLIVSEATPFNENTFQTANGLENITFEGVIGYSLSFVDSPLLSNASVQSIIDHLKDLTGATAKTLTFHATVGGNMTAEQKAAISAKNWTLVY